MTICIGTICDNGKKAIVVTDRMVTSSGLSVEFEHETKILKIGRVILKNLRKNLNGWIKLIKIFLKLNQQKLKKWG